MAEQWAGRPIDAMSPAELRASLREAAMLCTELTDQLTNVERLIPHICGCPGCRASVRLDTH